MDRNQEQQKPQPGFFPCKGSREILAKPDTRLSPRQTAWMLENKPAYHTGNALQDLPHLPRELRFV